MDSPSSPVVPASPVPRAVHAAGKARAALVGILLGVIVVGTVLALARYGAFTRPQTAPQPTPSVEAPTLRAVWYTEERTGETWEGGYQQFSYHYDLRSANLDGSDEKSLLQWDLPPVGAVSVIRALPGQRVAIYRFAGSDDLKVINADGTPASLAGLPRDSKIMTVVGSPDGSHLAYTDYETGFAVVDKSGSGGWYDFPKGVGGPNGVGIGPLLDDGCAVFNWGDAGAASSWLVRYDAPGGPAIVDHRDWGFSKSVAYLDCDHVLVMEHPYRDEESASGPTTISVATLSTGTTAHVATLQEPLSGAYFSDDRRHLVVPAEGRFLFADIADGRLSEFSEIPVPAEMRDIRWMPDGRVLMIVSDAVAGTAGAYVVDVNSRQSTRLDAFPVGTLVDQYGNSRLIGVYPAATAARPAVPSTTADAGASTAPWALFSSRYFTLSFQVPPFAQVIDGQNGIAVAKAPYYTREIGDDNAFLSLSRYAGPDTKAARMAAYRKSLLDLRESTLTVDGIAFPVFRGTDAGRFEGDSAGRVVAVFFDASSLEIIERPANSDQDFDPIAVGERMLTTFRFSR